MNTCNIGYKISGEAHIELRILRNFIAVVEEEGVSAAADALRISQPALSRQIKDLED